MNTQQVAHGYLEIIAGVSLLAVTLAITFASVHFLQESPTVEEGEVAGDTFLPQANPESLDPPSTDASVRVHSDTQDVEVIEGTEVHGSEEEISVVPEENVEGEVEEETEESILPSLSDITYPGSSTIEGSLTTLTLSTADSPSEVTEWYENLIRDWGLSVTSFVKTSSNGNIHNELTGAKNFIEVSAAITSDAESGETTIHLSLE